MYQFIFILLNAWFASIDIIPHLSGVFANPAHLAHELLCSIPILRHINFEPQLINNDINSNLPVLSCILSSAIYCIWDI